MLVHRRVTPAFSWLVPIYTAGWRVRVKVTFPRPGIESKPLDPGSNALTTQGHRALTTRCSHFKIMFSKPYLDVASEICYIPRGEWMGVTKKPYCSVISICKKEIHEPRFVHQCWSSKRVGDNYLPAVKLQYLMKWMHGRQCPF